MTQKHLISTKQNNYSNFIIAFLLFTITLLLINSCNTTEPPPKIINGTSELTVEDVSSTEVWLNVKLQNVNLPAELKLFREDSVTRIFNPSISDTLLYEEGLLPNKTYTYKVTIQATNKTTIQSKAVTLTTMDTTSHNFTWQTYTFGGANGSSVLNDVAIINENDIWAVGEIHTAETDQFDSNGVWVDPYNAVHWDGNSWELRRIIVNFRGNNTFIPLEGIFAFSSNDIWVVGSLPIHGDGNNWEIYDVREITNSNLSLSKAWGTSSNNMYFVGRGGSIAHYNGSGWTKIESGTETDIQDIWGVKNQEGAYDIYCAVSFVFNPGDKEILVIRGSQVYNRITMPLNRRVHSVWGLTTNNYYTSGGGVFRNNIGNWDEIKGLPNYFTEKIRGSGKNNVITVGDFGLIAQYNGMSWKVYNELNDADIYFSVAVKNGITAICGMKGAKGIIILGKN